MDPNMKGKRTGPPAMKAWREYINPGEEDQMMIQGYRLVRWQQALTWAVIFLTVGLLRLVFYWLPHWMIRCTHTKCSLAQADTLVLKDQYDQYFVSKVQLTTHAGTRVTVVQKKAPGFSLGKKKQRNITFQSPIHDDSLIKYFVTKKVKYIWDGENETYIKLKGLQADKTCSYFHNLHGLTIQDQEKRRVLYGINSIAVHVTPIVIILFKEVLSPFYVFQLFSMCVWYSDQYEIYASCIVVMSALGILATIYQTRKMQRALRNTICASTIVTVCRGGEDEFQDIPSEDLVPGDIIEVPRHGCVMQCDAILLSGNCIVNESMLTGESLPVTKTPIPNPQMSSEDEPKFDIKHHARHVLFCGTHVIQTRYYGNQRVRAAVIRTGFSTAKGELVRSILYPKPVDFKFNRHTYWFVGFLACVAAVGFIYTIILMVHNEDTVSDIIIRSLDLVTITVPPALPAALTVGILFAQQRLKRRKIFCISPRGINICGSINAVCFDKTGTLTEDGMKMQGVVPVSNKRFESEIQEMHRVTNSKITGTMAACHSLTIIDGQLSGDPLDLIMFEATGWVLEEPGEEETRFDMMVPTIVHPPANGSATAMTGTEMGIVRQFTFSSSLQRMSVVTRKREDSNFELYVKGAPEMIASLSNPDTVPSDFQEVLLRYTQRGYRVIALAWKPLSPKLNFVKVQRIQREQVEVDLNFLGLLVMENKLKPETTPVIHTLREANIRTIMVTGDNILTAMSVARECGMIDRTDRIILLQAYPPVDGKRKAEIEFVYAEDRERKVEEVMTMDTSIQIDEENQRFHFALTGKSWGVIRVHFPDLLSKIVVRGTVFARMSPDQKAQLVETLQIVGYYVGMCGDGANDCGALKTAHTGISLSEAEASVASPFTSKTPTIECVPTVIREGRAALVTSFGIFKYMACYSLTQFLSVLLLYWIGANLTDPEFLFTDLFVITTLSITFGYTEAHEELVKELPPVSLVSVGPIASIILHTLINAAAQIYCFMDIQRQSWFVPFEDNEDDDYQTHINTAVFLISAYQYIILSVAFAKGRPYRRPMYTNLYYMANLVVCLAGALWLTIYPVEGLANLMEVEVFPSIPYRLLYVGIAAINFLVCMIVESFLIDGVCLRRFCRRSVSCRPSGSQYKYSSIERQITADPNWPPVSPSHQGLASILERLDSGGEAAKSPQSPENGTAPSLQRQDSVQDGGPSESNSISSAGGKRENSFRKSIVNSGLPSLDTQVSIVSSASDAYFEDKSSNIPLIRQQSRDTSKESHPPTVDSKGNATFEMGLTTKL